MAACIRRWGGLAAIACMLATPAAPQSTPSITGFALSAPAISPQLHVQLDWTSPSDGAFDSYKATYQSTGSLITATYNLTGTDSAALHGTLYSTTGTARPVQAPGVADRMIIVGLKPNTVYTITLQACTFNMTFCGPAVSGSYTTAKYEGFGYQSVGGGEQTFCAASNISTLRTCCGGHNRYIVFTQGGNYDMSSGTSASGTIDCRWNNITIDGSAAPSPGVTIRSNSLCLNDGFRLGGCGVAGCGGSGDRSHQIITYVRFSGTYYFPTTAQCCRYNSSCANPGTCQVGATPDACSTCADSSCTQEGCASCDDGFAMLLGASGAVKSTHTVTDHCSFEGFGDSATDISGETQDHTFSKNVIAYNFHAQLVSGKTSGGVSTRITMHHNLYANNSARSPRFDFQHALVDFSNNILYQLPYDPAGSARAYGNPETGIWIDNAQGGSTDIENIAIQNNYFKGMPTPPASTNRDHTLLQYGSSGGCDSTENSSCANMCAIAGVSCTNTITGAGCSPATSTCCAKQGNTVTGATVLMDTLYVAGNVFPAKSCDEYSTTAQVPYDDACTGSLCVPSAARVTLDTADNLETTVLPAAGTWYRNGTELALIADVQAKLRPELLTDGGFETGSLSAQFATVPAVCDCPTPVAGIDTTAPPGPQAGTYFASATYAACVGTPCQALKLTLSGLTVGRQYTFSGYWATPYTGTTLYLFQNGSTVNTTNCFFTDVAIAGTNPIRNTVVPGCIIHKDTPASANIWSQFSAIFKAEATSHIFYFYGDAVSGPANLGVQVDSLSVR